MLQIRVIRRDDHPALIELWVASWRETMPTIDFEARREWIARFLAERAHHTLVADEAGALRGFASVEARLLHQLVVAPDAKGSGISQALMDTVKANATAGLDLEVNQENARAIRFYERHGFVCIGEGANPISGRSTFHMSWRRPDLD